MKKYFLILSFCLQSLSLVQGQGKDSFGIHMDRAWYQSGDTAWFSLSLPQDLLYENAVVNLQLFDIDRKSVIRFHLPIIHKRAQGFLPLPESLQSGIYELAFSVKDKDNSHSLIEAAHFFALLKAEGLPEYLDLPKKSKAELTEKALQLRAIFSKNQFEMREPIQLQIQCLDANGNPTASELSVSVSEKTEQGPFPTSSIYPTSNLPTETSQSFGLSGQIFVKGSPHANKDIALIDLSKAEVVKFKTTDLGRFNVALKPFLGQRNFQFWDLFDEEIEVVIDQGELEGKRVIGTDSLSISPFNQWLEINTQRKQIQTYFHPKIEAETGKNSKKWPIAPDFSIRPGDYQPFPDLETFLQSIYTPLKIRRKKNLPVPKMVNPEERPFFKHPPIFFINHSLSNFQELMQIKMPELIQMDIYHEAESLKKFWPLGQNGIVSVQTLDTTFRRGAKNLIRLEGFQKNRSYPRELNQKEEASHPILNPLIYWHPDLKTDEKGRLNLSFFHPDEIGSFQITVLARSSDGRWGSQSFTYQVESSHKE